MWQISKYGKATQTSEKARITQKYGMITNAIKLKFKTALGLAQLRIGSELIG